MSGGFGVLDADRREPRAGVGGLLTRALGFLVWENANPATLPVPPLGGTVAAGSGAGIRLLALGAWIAAAAVLGASLTATASIRGVAREALLGPHRDPGAPLTAVADELDSRSRDAWWRWTCPGAVSGLRRSAERIRNGIASIEAAAASYRDARAALAPLDLPGRALRGPAAVEAVEKALARVETPWHRGSLACEEMRAAIEPYVTLRSRPIARISGLVIEAPPDHGLAVAILRPDGSLAESSRILRLGDPFSLPFEEGTLVELSAIRLPEQRIDATRRVPIEAWSPVPGPTGPLASFAIRFAAETVEKAPPLPPLSRIAEGEMEGGGASR